MYTYPVLFIFTLYDSVTRPSLTVTVIVQYLSSTYMLRIVCRHCRKEGKVKTKEWRQGNDISVDRKSRMGKNKIKVCSSAEFLIRVLDKHIIKVGYVGVYNSVFISMICFVSGK